MRKRTAERKETQLQRDREQLGLDRVVDMAVLQRRRGTPDKLLLKTSTKKNSREVNSEKKREGENNKDTTYGCVCGRALAKNRTGRETKELEEERSSIGAYILPMIIVMIRLAERFSFFFFELLEDTRPLLNAKRGAKNSL